MLAVIELPEQTDELEVKVNSGKPPCVLNWENVKVVLLDLSLETAIIVLPIISRCEALPFPVVG
jgi:hypothetical protein